MHGTCESCGSRACCFQWCCARALSRKAGCSSGGTSRRPRTARSRVILWRFSIWTPHALERAGPCIKDHHAPITVAVGDVNFVCLSVHKQVARLIYAFGVRTSLAYATPTDLEE